MPCRADSNASTLDSGSTRPTLSVIIPVYNCENHVTHAIRSCLAQSEPPDEIVVVDDGSTDATPAMLGVFADCPSVRVIRQANQGVSLARNAGVQASTGTFVAFLDADDELYPHALKARRDAAIAHPEADVFFSDYDIGDIPGVARSAHQPLDVSSTLGRHFEHDTGNAIRLAPGFADAYARYTIPHSLVHTSAITVRRSLFDRTEGFRPDKTVGEDYDLWIRLFLAGQAVLLKGGPQSVYFRWRGETGKYQSNARDRVRLLRESVAGLRPFSREWRAIRRQMANTWLSMIYASGVERSDRATLLVALARSVACYPVPWYQAKYACLLLLPRPVLRRVYSLRASTVARRAGRDAIKPTSPH